MARTVAALVYEHFAGADTPGELVASTDTIEEMISAAFWASLRSEEGRAPRVSLAYLPRPLCESALNFARPLPLSAAALAKLAPAVEQPGIHLAIEREGPELRIWGTTRRIPPGTFVLEVVRPGLIVVKQRRSDAAEKFANLVVLEGDEINVVHQGSLQTPELHPFVAHLLSPDAPRTWSDPANVTVQLATAMRAHKRGGSLLIVPAGSFDWQDSIVYPVVYEVAPAYAGIAVLLEQQAEPGLELLWRERLRRAVEILAGMTAVDGATIIDTRYQLLAFGAKIRRRPLQEPLQQVLISRIVDGVGTRVINVSELGGTRHLSAAQFAHDQRDSLALVASQDGNFTAFAWSPAHQLVAAYRVEALLL